MLAVFALSGCRVDSRADVEVRANGTGKIQLEVLLDREAALAFGVWESRLDLADLRDQGWKFDFGIPGTLPHGARMLTASRGFASVEEANALMQHLSGDSGVFQDFHLQQDRSFWEVTTEFSGRLNLTNLLDQIVAPLSPDDREKFMERTRLDANETFPVGLSVRFPGGKMEADPAPDANGYWYGVPGQITSLTAKGTTMNVIPKARFALGVAAIGFAVMLWVFWRPGRRGNKSRIQLRRRVTWRQWLARPLTVDDESSSADALMSSTERLNRKLEAMVDSRVRADDDLVIDLREAKSPDSAEGVSGASQEDYKPIVQ